MKYLFLENFSVTCDQNNIVIKNTSAGSLSNYCKTHRVWFGLLNNCPTSSKHRKGDIVELSDTESRSLLKYNIIEHYVEKSTPIAGAAVSKINKMLSDNDLPLLDEDSISIISRPPAAYSSHNRKLARDLGLSADDIDEIKKLARQ